MNFLRYFAIVSLFVCLNGNIALSQTGDASQSKSPPLYWSDADSGRYDGVKFRLANIDAPETGSLKQRGGAKCEKERALGYAAKAGQIKFTTGKSIELVRDYGRDRYGRRVVDMSANGEDVGAAGIRQGYLRHWPHENGRALAPKPDWCRNE